jgi:glutamate N-acetyltransferase/amino-acid N-acetyltransferase
MSITRPMGFRAAATTAGIKPSGKSDLALIVCDVPGADSASGRLAAGAGVDGHARLSSAAVFTRNQVVGAPVELGRKWRASYLNNWERGSSLTSEAGVGALRAILINAGCSNAATGTAGIEDAKRTMRSVAEHYGCSMESVLPSSTGIIGHRLPVEKINAAVPGLVKTLARSKEADEATARAIMTTDLVPKSAHRELEMNGHTVHLGAICKGSGMIAPSMDSWGDIGGVGPHGTMLAFITTDACIDAPCLQVALEHACRESFDRVSVDAHPSCSDTVLCMASGHAATAPIHRNDPAFFGFQRALSALCEELAMRIVRDGEGATRVFRVEVKGTRNNDEAARIARAVVDSPLVKCAIHGKDPNWGRIVTAAGNAGVRFDPAESSLVLGSAAGGAGTVVEVYRHGLPTGVQKDDTKLVAAMNADPVFATLTVGHGPGHAFMLGCDLSAKYVSINADYTT